MDLVVLQLELPIYIKNKFCKLSKSTGHYYGITTELLQNYYRITTELLQPYYSYTTGLQTVGHYSDYASLR